MAARTDIPVEVARRRQRRAALALAAIPALLVSAFLADVFRGGEGGAPVVAPAPAKGRTAGKSVEIELAPPAAPVPHGARRKAQGAPGQPTGWANDADWDLPFGFGSHYRFAPAAFHPQGPSFGGGDGIFLYHNLPTLGPGGGSILSGGGSGGGGGGGGNGGDGDGAPINCTLAFVAGVCGAPDQEVAGSDPQDVPVKILPAGNVAVDDPQAPGEETRQPDPVQVTGGGGAPGTGTPSGSGPDGVPGVPEPGAWAMMITGFLLCGWSLRAGRRPESGRQAL